LHLDFVCRDERECSKCGDTPRVKIHKALF
jgi:hypothetical protein